MDTKVLLVDDDKVILHMFSHALEKAGYTIITAENGSAGLELFEEEQPDIVLLDLRLPGIDGLTVLQEMHTRAPEADVIPTTAYGDRDAVLAALRAGATDFLLKPLDKLALQSAVRRAEERIRLKRELRASQEALRRQNERREQQIQARTAALEREIAKRKQTHAALQESEARFAKAFYANPAPMTISTLDDGTIVDINDSCLSLLGYTRDEMIGHTSRELGMWLNPKNRDVEIQRLLQRSSPHSQEEIRLRAHSGEIKTLLATGEIITIQNQPLVLWSYRDITERKRAENALEKRVLALTMPLNEAQDIQFEALFNLDDIQRLQDEFSKATGVASIITHPDGTPITQPSNFCQLCNDIIRQTDKGRANCYNSDATLGRFSREGPIIQPCMSGGLWDAGAAILVGGQHIANWLIGQVRDDTQSEVKIRAYAREIGADEDAAEAAFRNVPAMSREQFGNIAQALFTLANQLSTTAYQNIQQARFIAERKRAQEALRASEEKYRLLAETTRDIILLLDANGYIVYVNQAGVDSSGFAPSEVIGKRISKFLPEAHQAALTTRWEQRLAGDEGAYRYETTFVNRAGQHIPVEVDSIPFQIEGNVGEPLILVVARNITERVEAESQLRFQAHLLDTVEQAVIVTDIEGHVVYWNPFAEQLYGWSAEEVLGQVTLELTESDQAQQHNAEIMAHLQTGKSWSGEYLALHRDGTRFPTQLSITPLYSAQGALTHIVSISSDITERKRLEKQVQHRLIALTQPEVDLGDLALTDLIGLATLQNLQDAFADAFNMPSIIYGPDGAPLTKPSRFTDFCTLVRSTEQGAADCEAFDAELMRALRENRSSQIRYGCALSNVVTGTVPIVLQDRHLANWGIGQMVNGKLDLDEIRQYAREIGLPGETLIEAAQRLPVLDDYAAFERAVTFLSALSEQVNLLALQNLQQGRDIAARAQAEAALLESEARYRSLAENFPNGALFLFDQDFCYLAADGEGLAQAGLSREKIVGRKVVEVFPDLWDTIRPHCEAALKGQESYYEVEYNGRVYSNQALPIISDTPLNRPQALVVTQDITERKQAEEHLKQVLADKTALVQELYHRTKNNMQVIIGMLALQAASLDDARLSEAFTDMEHRIHAMALAHQALYKAQHLSRLDLRQYILDLSTTLMKNYQAPTRKISLTTEMDEVHTLIDTAMPCGLVLNELLTNSLKHAFPDNQGGQISICLQRGENGQITLTIADNGVGVPTDFDFRACTSIGIRTTIGLVEHQLGGQITFEVNGGITCHIRFTDTLYEERV